MTPLRTTCASIALACLSAACVAPEATRPSGTRPSAAEQAETPPRPLQPQASRPDAETLPAADGRTATDVAPVAAVAPPSDWKTSSTTAFGADLDAWSAALPAAGAPFEEAALSELSDALARADDVAARAAVLLAWSRSEASDDALLTRLEARLEAPGRGRKAVDVIAAAALEGRGTARGLPARLSALASGASAHPDLVVRVECARSALAAGRTEVTDFLLRVLRTGTPTELDHPGDWPPIATVAWPKSRAAEALSRHLGVDCQFRPDASFEDQETETRRLEALLR